jgi:hypothetical protein
MREGAIGGKKCVRSFQKFQGPVRAAKKNSFECHIFFILQLIYFVKIDKKKFAWSEFVSHVYFRVKKSMPFAVHDVRFLVSLFF